MDRADGSGIHSPKAGARRPLPLRAAAPARRLLAHLVLALEERLAVGNPARRIVALQVVPEPGEDPLLIVDLVLRLAQPVVLALVFEQNHVLLGAPRDVEEFEPLVP